MNQYISNNQIKKLGIKALDEMLDSPYIVSESELQFIQLMGKKPRHQISIKEWHQVFAVYKTSYDPDDSFHSDET